MRRISAYGHLTLGPSLSYEGGAVVEIAALDVLLGRGDEQFVGEVVPYVAVGVAWLVLVEFVEEAS